MSAYLPILIRIPDAVDHTDRVAVAEWEAEVLLALADAGVIGEVDDEPEQVVH